MTEQVTLAITNKVNELLTTDALLYLVAIKADIKYNIKVYIDGDNGVTISTCTQLNRALYSYIEEAALISNNDFSLEVSSPGAEEPIILARQYIKNIGRKLLITLLDDSTKTGTLLNATTTNITLQETTGKGVKAITTDIDVAIAHIKNAVVVLQFK